MVSVCTGLLGKESRVNILGGYKTINQTPLPLPLIFSHEITDHPSIQKCRLSIRDTIFIL